MNNNHRNQSGIGVVAAVIIVALLLVGGGAVYYFSGGSGAEKAEKTGSETRVDEGSVDSDSSKDTKSGAVASSREEFIALFGSDNFKNMTCTYDYSAPEVSGKATIKIKDDNNYRVDMTGTAEGKPISMHILALSDSVYMWEDTAGQGMKMTVSAEEIRQNLQDFEFDSNTEIDEEQIANFSCRRGGPTASELSAPTSVQFFDPASMMQGLQF